MAQTKIDWATHVLNWMHGCTKCSDGCKNCYMFPMANRLKGRCGYDANEPAKVTLALDKLEELTKKQKPRRIFTPSMGDPFHPDVPFMAVGLALGHFYRVNQHTYMMLTKRPERALEFFKWYNEFVGFNAWPREYPHVYLGVTADNQEMADKRIPILLQIPAAVRFVSIEPMLGPVDLTHIDADRAGHSEYCQVNALTGRQTDMGRPCRDISKLDWVICGGETGHHARPAHPDWFKSLRDQCKAAGIPFFFKGWGEFKETELDCVEIAHANREGNPKLEMVFKNPDQEFKTLYDLRGCATYMEKVGKKKAGRLLDGIEHNEFPEAHHD